MRLPETLLLCCAMQLWLKLGCENVCGHLAASTNLEVPATGAREVSLRMKKAPSQGSQAAVLHTVVAMICRRRDLSFAGSS